MALGCWWPDPGWRVCAEGSPAVCVSKSDLVFSVWGGGEGVACGGMLLGFRAPSGILFLRFSFHLFIFQRRGSFPVKCLQGLTEVTSTRHESRTEVRTAVTAGGKRSWAARACEGRAQGMRVSYSCRSALASRLWQPGLAQEVIFRTTWRMQAGWSEEKSGPRSQSGLQGRVQDVIVVAVAVGVTVVALGAGVVGCLLQPHQHVHLWRQQRWEGQSVRGKSPSWPLWSSCHLL